MPLVEIELPISDSPIPGSIVEFLDEADTRIGEFMRTHRHGTTFVASDFVAVYQTLLAITDLQLVSGNRFCEWGSGFGVAASLAAKLGYAACGIEIDRDLVDAAQEMANAFDLDVKFVHGSFVPQGCEDVVEAAYAESGPESFRLVTESDRAYEELEIDPDEFDLIFAYPWPEEENAVQQLFEQCAAHGALLLTFGRCNSMCLQRQVRSESLGNHDPDGAADVYRDGYEDDAHEEEGDYEEESDYEEE